MALIQKAFSDIITFSRSSNATRIGPNGLVQYAPHNLILQSQTLDNASWTKTRSSVTANSTAAPDGTVTAETLIEDATASSTHLIQQDFTAVSGTTYTQSYFVKASTRTWCAIFGGGLAFSTGPFAFFNLATGALGSTGNGALSATITLVGNGWYRITLTVSATTGSTANLALRLATGDNTSSYSGDGTSGIFIWGAQLSVGPLALDYTPTTTAAVYGPRFDYDPSGVTSVDPIARNLVLRSDEFDNASWTKSNVTATANAVVSPDGTTSADKIAASGTTSVQHAVTQTAGSPSTLQTLSIYAKAAEQSFLWLSLYDSTNRITWFNLTTGVVGTNASGSTASITAVGNGWYRCSITRTTDATAGPQAIIGFSNADNVAVYADTIGNGIYLWGAQLELGNTATGYMVSGATNGFRAVPVVTGNATPRGLLVEEQRTNLLTYSEMFADASWTKTAATVTANVVAAPDGTVTADKLVEDTANTSHFVAQTANCTSGVSYTFSVYAKAAERTQCRLRASGSGGWLSAVVNLTDGSVVSGATGQVTVTSVGNAWYRISVTATSDLTGSNLFSVYPAQGDTWVYQGNGTSGIYIWGAQLEAGAFATSYIPTLASSVTRSADVASVNTLSPWFNATEGTLYVETVSKNVLGTSKLPAALNSAAYATNSISPFIYSTARLRLLIYAGGVITGDMYPATVYSDNQTIKFGAAYKLNDFALSANGATPTTDTSGDVPTGIDRLDLGVTAGLTTFSGWLNRVAYYPRRLTNAELQALSA